MLCNAHSEAILLEWLRLAVTMASVAVLLLGYSAIAYVNPLKRPTLHVAEIISLLLLPGSCVIVGYAIRVFVWRGKRLHSMRYRCARVAARACGRARASLGARAHV